jgi:hypothetical protein
MKKLFGRNEIALLHQFANEKSVFTQPQAFSVSPLFWEISTDKKPHQRLKT